jgi:hypothetical protein
LVIVAPGWVGSLSKVKLDRYQGKLGRNISTLFPLSSRFIQKYQVISNLVVRWGVAAKYAKFLIKKGLSVKKGPLKGGAGEQIRTVVTSLEG